MGDKEETIQDIKTQRLLDLYFASASSPSSIGVDKNLKHLDADTLAAFVESSLSLRETEPVVSHLVECGFCRKSSAELIRLQFQFSAEPARMVAKESETSRISEVLSGLLQKILGTSDAAVFAHEESDQNKEKAKQEKDDPEQQS